jgi:adenylate cyclase
MSKWTSDLDKKSAERIKQYDSNRRRHPPQAGKTIPELDNLPIGGSRVFHLAVLSIDIRDFTKIALDFNEKRVEDLARFQALYLSEMSAIIRDFKGETEKYTGDGVLGLFGTEFDTNASSDVKNAINAGLTVKLELKNSLNPYFRRLGYPEISVGMGIDYGTVIMERVGLRGNNQFSLSGPTVSLAAKLQGQAQAGQILVGEDVKKRFPSEELSRLQKFEPNWKYTYPSYLYNAVWQE